MDLIREGLARLREEDRSSWSGPAQTARLLELRELQERVDAEVVRASGDGMPPAPCAEDDGPRPGVVAGVGRRLDAPRRAAAKLLRPHGSRRTTTARPRRWPRARSPCRTCESLAVVAHRRGDAVRRARGGAARRGEDGRGAGLPHRHPAVGARWPTTSSRREDAELRVRAPRHHAFPDARAAAWSAGSSTPRPRPPSTVRSKPRSRRRVRATRASLRSATRMRLVLMSQRSLGGELPESRPITGIDAVVTLRRARRPGDDRARRRCGATSTASARSRASPPNGSRATARSAGCVIEGTVRDPRPRPAHPHGPPRLRRLVRVRDEHCQYPGLPGAGGVVRRAPSRALAPRRRDEARELALLCRRHHVAVPRGRLEARTRTERPYARGVSDDVLAPASSRCGSPACKRCCAAKRSPPCRAVTCTACCTSSQFVHIEPDETDTLAHIPAALRFPAPGTARRGTWCSGTTSGGTARCWATTGARSTSTALARAAPTTAGCSRPPASSPTRASRRSPPRSAGGASTSATTDRAGSPTTTTPATRWRGRSAHFAHFGRFGKPVRDRRDRGVRPEQQSALQHQHALVVEQVLPPVLHVELGDAPPSRSCWATAAPARR